MFAKIDKRLLTILLIVFVQMVGASMILPILPLFAKREFAMRPQVITLLVSAFFAAQFLAGPSLGRLSDQYGRLPILVISQIGTAVSFFMIAAAQGPLMLFAARILDGITGGNIIVAQAYITDITPRERRTEALGLVLAMFGIGFAIGPALGGVLAAAFGVRTPYLFAAMAAVVTVLITWFNLEETVTGGREGKVRSAARPRLRFASVLGNRNLLLILSVAFVGQFAFGMLQSTFSLFGEAVLFAGATESSTNLGIGLLLGTVGLSQFLTQTFLLRRLLRWLGERWLVFFGNSVRMLSFLLLALVASPWLAIIPSVLFAVGMGTMMPPLQSLTTGTVPDEMRGGVLGVYQSVISLATIVSTAVAGTFFNVAPTMPYWAGFGLSLLVYLPALFLISQGGSISAGGNTRKIKK